MRVEQLSEGVTLYLADCREVLPTLGRVDAVVTDPPYPNNSGHFVEGIETAREVMTDFFAPHWIVFWTEIEVPPVPLVHVATHVWYRTNSNRADNYEPAFEFRADGQKRASRVLPYYVIAPGLTGIEASGHPTEKHVGLMQELVKRTSGIVLDPFMGSGTTGVACARRGQPFIGIEIEPAYFDIACRRVETALDQLDLFIDHPVPARQEALKLST